MQLNVASFFDLPALCFSPGRENGSVFEIATDTTVPVDWHHWVRMGESIPFEIYNEG